MHGGNQIVGWTGLHWLDGVSKEAVRRGRSLLFWVNIGLMILSVVGGVVYQFMGRDIRHDIQAWYNRVDRAADIRHGRGALGELRCWSRLSASTWDCAWCAALQKTWKRMP